MVEVCFVLLILLALGGAYIGVCTLKSLINEWIVCVLFIFLRPVPDQLMNRTRGGVPGCQLPIRGHHALEEGGLKIFFLAVP